MNVFAKFGTMRVVAVVLLASTCLYGCDVFSVVFFRDKALESAVRSALDKPFGPLTVADCKKVREIQAASLNIRDLSGIENCQSLTILNLRGNMIQSITPLMGLRNIVRLDLGENVIKNIEPIAGMLFLEELIIYGDLNEIVDWSPLAANSQAGGLGTGNTVLLPTKTTIDSSGNPLPNFAAAREVLLNNGVTIFYGDPSTPTTTTTTAK